VEHLVTEMSTPIGWYVRVWVGENESGDHGAALYIAGYPTPVEAEAAVRRTRSKRGERMEVLEGEIVPGVGPQPSPGEVRLLGGAI
jgi:hypothetical protein